MTSEINRLSLPGRERLVRNRVSLLWWPNYKDRRIWRQYRSFQPYSNLRLVYPGSLVVACLMILAAILVSAHVSGGVQ